MRCVTLGAALVLSSCATTLAPFERAQVYSQRFESAPASYFPIADASYRGWRDPHWEILSFFEAANDEIVARRIEGDRRRETGTSWASSRDCPGVVVSIQELSNIEMPVFNYPLPRPSSDGEEERAIILTADGAAISVRMDGRYERPDGDHLGVDYSVGGNVDSPAGVWFAETQQRLSNCWRENQPPIDRRP